MLVDSHCHLNFSDFSQDIEDVISRAQHAGVVAMQTICTELTEFEEVYSISERYSGIFASVGVHPNESGKTPVTPAAELVRLASRPKVIGIGETGLDYHYQTSDRDTQRESFKQHIHAARESGLPLIVHSRDADQDTVDILSEAMEEGAFSGLIHCFTSSKYLADKAIEMGFYISLSGIISFKSAQAIRDAIADVPLDRLLVETDAPYLAPTPHRGKRNEPSFVLHTNRVLAEIKQISEQECAQRTTANFYRLFTKAPAGEALSCA